MLNRNGLVQARYVRGHWVSFRIVGNFGRYLSRLVSGIAEQAEDKRSGLSAFPLTVSQPLAPGEHKRIAVKIVDDQGIESLKMLEVE